MKRNYSPVLILLLTFCTLIPELAYGRAGGGQSVRKSSSGNSSSSSRSSSKNYDNLYEKSSSSSSSYRTTRKKSTNNSSTSSSSSTSYGGADHPIDNQAALRVYHEKERRRKAAQEFEMNSPYNSGPAAIPAASIFQTVSLKGPTSLAFLAVQYGISTDSIKSLNPTLADRNTEELLQHGMSLDLPRTTPMKTHMVLNGETWKNISKKYDVNPDAMAKLNHPFLPESEAVMGRQILIPHETGYYSEKISRGVLTLFIVGLVVGLFFFFKKSSSTEDEEDLFEGIEIPVDNNGFVEGVTPEIVACENLDDKLKDLLSRDPAFSVQQFEDYVSTAFFKVQRAWCKRDMSSARAYISDSVLKRFSLQLEEYIDNNRFNKLDGLNTKRVELIDIREDGHYDTLDVVITASAVDYVIDENNMRVSGSHSPVTWDESWSFMRSKTVKTDTQKGLQVDTCPSCGAPLTINASGVCEYCNNTITKGEFDWVLSEITQLN